MSIELTHRCGVCRCYLDDEDLFCANCGTENPFADDRSVKLEHGPSHHSFNCQSCGASMSYDASAQALRCPFCGSTRMERRESARAILPDRVLQFSIERAAAETALRAWLSSGFWRPADASRASTIGEMTRVYVPYWVFEASTDSRWTADSSPAPLGSRGDWYPVSGGNVSNYTGILVAGSSILTARETDSIAPFDIAQAQPASQVDLENSISEDFRVPRKLARPAARKLIENRERQACRRHVPNRVRNLKVNVRVASMVGQPLLLPVWILAYRYKEKVHRVLINGQSGKIAGTAPFSYRKLTAIIAVVVILLIVIGVIAALSS